MLILNGTFLMLGIATAQQKKELAEKRAKSLANAQSQQLRKQTTAPTPSPTPAPQASSQDITWAMTLFASPQHHANSTRSNEPDRFASDGGGDFGGGGATDSWDSPAPSPCPSYESSSSSSDYSSSSDSSSSSYSTD